MSVGDMDLGWESVKAFSGKMVQAVFGFVGVIIFARVLGPTEFGGFYFLLALVLIADRPVRGFGSAVKKRYAEHDSKERELVGAFLLFNLVASIIILIVLLPFNNLLEHHTNVEMAAFVFVVLFVTLAFFSGYQDMLAANGFISKQTWNDTLRSILTLPLQLMFVFVGLGAAGMGYGLAGATILSAGVGVLIVAQRPSYPTVETVKSVMSFAKYSIPSGFVGKAYDRFDVLLLGFLLSTATVGYYETALKLTLPATFLSGVILSGLMPQVSHMYSKQKDPSGQINYATSYVSIIPIPIFFGALAMPDAIVRTAYGMSYIEAAPYLVGLAFYQILFTQSGVYRSTLNGIDRPDLKLRIDIVTLTINVILGVSLLFTIGGIGVVIATVISEVFRYGAAAIAVRRHVSNIVFFPRSLIDQIVIGSAMFVVVRVMYLNVGVQSWFDLGFIVGVGAIVYIGILLVVSEPLRITVRAVAKDSGIV